MTCYHSHSSERLSVNTDVKNSQRRMIIIMIIDDNAQCITFELLRSQIHEYGHVRNRHIMFITIEHRNLGIRKHVTTSCSGTKPFY